MKPNNAIAETVDNLKEQVTIFEGHIVDIQARIDKTNATIAELEPLGEWIDVP